MITGSLNRCFGLISSNPIQSNPIKSGSNRGLYMSTIKGQVKQSTAGRIPIVFAWRLKAVC